MFNHVLMSCPSCYHSISYSRFFPCFGWAKEKRKPWLVPQNDWHPNQIWRFMATGGRDLPTAGGWNWSNQVAREHRGRVAKSRGKFHQKMDAGIDREFPDLRKCSQHASAFYCSIFLELDPWLSTMNHHHLAFWTHIMSISWLFKLVIFRRIGTLSCNVIFHPESYL